MCKSMQGRVRAFEVIEERARVCEGMQLHARMYQTM